MAWASDRRVEEREVDDHAVGIRDGALQAADGLVTLHPRERIDERVARHDDLTISAWIWGHGIGRQVADAPTNLNP